MKLENKKNGALKHFAFLIAKLSVSDVDKQGILFDTFDDRGVCIALYHKLARESAFYFINCLFIIKQGVVEKVVIFVFALVYDNKPEKVMVDATFRSRRKLLVL